MSKPVVEERDTVVWVHFEESDVNDPRLLTAERNDLHARILPPLLLVIGYSNGYQVRCGVGLVEFSKVCILST